MVGICKCLQSKAFPREQQNMKMIVIIMVIVCPQVTWKSSLFSLEINDLFPEHFSFTSLCFFFSSLYSFFFPRFSFFLTLFLCVSLLVFPLLFLCFYMLFHSSMFHSISGVRLVSLYTFVFFCTLWQAKLISLPFMFPICTLQCSRCFHYCIKDWR
jgi:hypothetical protein